MIATPEDARGAGPHLQAPVGGWPARPLGGGDGCAEIAKWLYPFSARDLAYGIANPTDAYRSILAVGCWLLDDLRANDASPTFKDEEDGLRKVLKHTDALLKAIPHMPSMQNHLSHVSRASDFIQMRLAPEPGSLPYQLVPGPAILQTPLLALRESVMETLAFLEEVRKSGKKSDTLFARTFGGPLTTLAVRCALILYNVGGAEAVQVTEDGRVEELARRIWVFATGIDPGESFRRRAKEAAKTVRAAAAGGEIERSIRRDSRKEKKLRLRP